MQELTDANVLVVGGAGFVGGNLVQRLLDIPVRHITVVDNLLSSQRDNIPSCDQLRFVEGSIADDSVVDALVDEFEYVFHLATYHGNQSSIHDPLADHQNNTLTTLKLCQRLKDFSAIRRVVYASAGCTVAEKTFADAEATTEDAAVSLYLDSPYQISKIIGELYGNYYFARYGLPFVKARFQNVYGPGEILGAGRWRGTPATVWRNVTPTFVYRALKRLPLVLHDGGRATRDFIFVADIVEGLLRCAVYGRPGEVYNLASGVETSILQLARSINELIEAPAPIEIADPRDWDHSGRRYGSTLKAKEQLRFVARYSLMDGLRETIAWTQHNLERIEACIARHADQLAAAGEGG